jgi:hypothetical protein
MEKKGIITNDVNHISLPAEKGKTVAAVVEKHHVPQLSYLTSCRATYPTLAILDLLTSCGRRAVELTAARESSPPGQKRLLSPDLCDWGLCSTFER